MIKVDGWRLRIFFEIYEPMFHIKSCLEIRLEMRKMTSRVMFLLSIVILSNVSHVLHY